MFPQQRLSNRNSLTEIFLTLIGVGLSTYIAYINTRNLHYNARNASASEQIAKQLDKLNHSDLMRRVDCELKKENTL